MKKFLSCLIGVLLALALSLPCASAVVLNPDSAYTGCVDTAFMNCASPVIDAEISGGEGWGAKVSVDRTNTVLTLEYPVSSFTEAAVRFAFDDNNLYICAEITDDDFIYCTGESTEEVYRNPYYSPQNFLGWDGDVFALALDPLGTLIDSGRNLYSDMSAWTCFGLFEDGHVGVYRTRFGVRDLTGEVRTAGVRTEEGWHFEAALPWSVVADDLDASSFGIASLDREAMTADGAESRGCIFLVDRFFDEESEEIMCDNIFATLSEHSVKGVLTTYSSNPSVGSYGLKLVARRTADGYTPAEPRQTLEWQNCFGDLNTSAWYYPVVAASCNKGWFAGDGLGNFNPSAPLTRGMFVTVLAREARYDGYSAQGDVFEDAPADKWYSPSAEWAAERGIASGTGEGVFSPYAELTREEAALFLYRLAQFKGYRTDGVPDSVLDAFPDAAEVSDWARDAVEWAVCNRLIAGAQTDGGVMLLPRGGATRAQCAQLVHAFDSRAFTRFAAEDEYAALTLCGADIGEYVIIYGGEAQDAKAAQALADYIGKTTGASPAIASDRERAPQDCEILIGHTNREGDFGAVDRTGVTSEGYTIVSRGTKLLISGGEKKGTLYGVYAFIEKYLGWVFAWEDSEERYYNTEIDIPAGLCVTENSMLDLLGWIDGSGSLWNTKVRLCGDRVDHDDGYIHSIPWIMDGSWENISRMNPCYSDEEFISELTAKLLARMEANPNKHYFNLTQYDSNYYCLCYKCQRAYREEGSRAGAFVRMANRIAAVVAERYPQNTLLIIAYDFTTDAPESALADNIILRAQNISICFHHTLDDPDCPLNSYLYREILAWREKCSRFYVGEHGNTFDMLLSPVMNFEFMYRNIQIYGELGCTGYTYWGNTGTSGEFQELRDYLMAHMFWESAMSRDRYQIYMEEFLEAYYGGAWRDVLSYIDDMNIIQDPVHFANNANPSATVSKPLFVNSISSLDYLWSHALVATAGNEKDYAHTERSSAQYLFIRQVAGWESLYRDGDDISRNSYIRQSSAFDDLLMKYGIKWNEDDPRPNRIDYRVSPEYWS